MTDAYPGMTFDHDGVCRFCRPDEAGVAVDWAERRQELDEIVRRIRGEATSYHAIVPWSGGKDSSYVLYVMRREYDLNVLALNFDNGMKSSQAIENLDRLSRELGVDLVTVRPNPMLMNALYRHYLREKGELCSVCNVIGYLMMFSFVLNFSSSFGYLPLIVGGWSGTHENVRDIFTFDFGELKRVIQTDPGLLENLEASNLINPAVYAVLEKAGDPRVGATEISNEVASKFFHLPDFLEWDLIKIKSILKNELGWMSSDSPLAAHEDCRWHNCMKYLMKRKYNIDNDTIAISALVRSGLLSREDGLKHVAQLVCESEPPEMKALLETIGCSREEINFEAEWYTGENL